MSEFDYIFNHAKTEKVKTGYYYAYDMIVAGLKKYCGDNAVWLDEYNLIVDWLRDNNGKGLLVMGDVGVGKSLICYNILHTILGYNKRKVYTCKAVDLDKEIDKLHGEFIIIDDIGTEPKEFNVYGTKRVLFNEIVDNAETYGEILIITTNLMSPAAIIDRYGARTADRLKAITMPVVIQRKSFRGESVKGNIPCKPRAYGIDFNTKGEAEEFAANQNVIRDNVADHLLKVYPGDRDAYNEGQPMKVVNGIVYALSREINETQI